MKNNNNYQSSLLLSLALFSLALIFMPFFASSTPCTLEAKPNKNNTKVSNAKRSQVTPNSLLIPKLLGTWQIEMTDEVEEMFQLTFVQEKGKLKASYYNGGPFEEFFVCEAVSETEANLIYEFIAGSISFNKGRDNNKKECKVKVATVICENPNKIMVETFVDKCGYMPKNSKFILYKISD